MSPEVTTSRDADVASTVESLLSSWGQVQDLMARLPGVVERRFGIPSHRVHVLGAVERGATRIQDIAEASWISVSAASRTVDGMVRDGWLDRRPDPDDRRATQVTLTAEGSRRIEEVRDWGRDMVAGMVDQLGRQRVERMAADLSDFAERVHSHLDADTA